MEELAALLAAGKLAPIVDRCFPLGEVHEALRLLQSGRALGRILLTP
jgi:NADPH:quinone reductase-like Zn-dependent oxidoreductase